MKVIPQPLGGKVRQLPETPANGGRLLVLLSTERSGSTLLASMLGGNGLVLAPPEMHLLRFPDFESWRRVKPNALASLTWLMGQLAEPADEASLALRFRAQAATTVYRELLRLCGPSKVLVDKTPAYAREDSTLRRIETLRPFYVWLVRHPLGMVSSYLDRREQRYLARQSRARTAAQKLSLRVARTYERIWYLRGPYLQEKLAYWADLQTRIESFLGSVSPERWCRVQFEALVREPVAQLRILCAASNLELEPAMLQPGNNVPDTLAWGLGNEKIHQHSTIDPDVADRWRTRMDEKVLSPGIREIMRRVQTD